MNQHLYRIIFSHSLGQLIAVAETTRAQGKPGERGPGGGRRQGFSLRALCFATLLGFAGVAQAADIVVDAQAAAAKQPTLAQAPNGLTVVQITAPTAAGVSHNQYQQFNVSPSGAILNNSAQVSNTRLAGYIAGNANLKAGSARIILNEVTRPNPSSLNGFIEVAGQRAQVVIANPWGISCSGCGFINTSAATLTTGVPQLNAQGGISSYLVNDGTVTIDGLNDGETDSYSIISRAFKLNGALVAKRVNAVQGRNQVDADSLQATPLAEDASTKPVFSLDVAALGGMYAGVIKLVGTEKGVGVNQQGTLAAQAGDLQLSSAGDLTLAGSASAAGNLSLSGSKISGNGTLAAGVLPDGRFAQQGDLTLQASQALQTAGRWQAAGTLLAQAGTQLDLSHSTLSSAHGDLLLQAPSLAGYGVLQSGRDLGFTLDNWQLAENQTLQANRDVLLNISGRLDNYGRLLAVRNLQLNAGSLNNQGTLQASQKLDASLTQTLENSSSGAIAAETLNLYAPTLNNSGLITGNKLTLGGDSLNNLESKAAIVAAGDLALNFSSLLNNRNDALISAEGTLSIGSAAQSTRSVINRQATIQSSGDMTLYADSVENSSGPIVVTPVQKTEETRVQSMYQLPTASSHVRDCGSGGRDMCYDWRRYAAYIPLSGGSYSGSWDGLATLRYTLLNDDTQTHTLSLKRDITSPVYKTIREEHTDLRGRSYWTTRSELDGYQTATDQVTLSYSRVDGSTYYYLPGYNPASQLLPVNVGVVALLNPVQVMVQNAIDANDYHGETGDIFRGIRDQSDNFRPVAGRDITVPQAAPGASSVTTTVFIDQIKPENTPKPAMLSSGGSLTFHAKTVSNQQSRIASRQKLSAEVEQLIDNVGFSLNRTERRTFNQAGGASFTDDIITQIGSVQGSIQSGEALTLHAAEIKNTTVNAASGASAVAADGSPLDILPNSSLFHPSTRPELGYLIETDARFTQFKNFISSDYMMSKLAYNPATTPKRLGDGYYEQQLVNRQILQKTGQRYLGDYTDSNQQYQALLNNGLENAQKFNLTPGVALSAAQIKNLTSDMVWLVSQTVNGQQVLVPQVYFAANSASSVPQGGVLAGKSIQLLADGSLTNSGSLLARDTLSAQANNIQLLGGALQAKSASLTASQDLTLQGQEHRQGSGPALQAVDLTLHAGRDLKLGTDSQLRGGTLVASAGRDLSLDKSKINGDSLSLDAGHDLSLQRTQIKTQGNAMLHAGNDLNLASVQTSQTSGSRQDNGSNHVTQLGSQTYTEGNQIESGANLLLAADHDLKISASQASAVGKLQLLAGHDLNVQTTTDTRTEEQYFDHGSKSRGGTHLSQTLNQATLQGGEVQLLAGHDIGLAGAQLLSTQGKIDGQAGNDIKLSSVATQNRDSYYLESGTKGNSHDVTQHGSNLSATDGLNLAAGQDLNTQAAYLAAQKGLASLSAGRDLTLGFATNSHDDYTKKSSSSHGLFGGSMSKDVYSNQSSQAIGSVVLGDKVSMAARENLTLFGSEVRAKAGDVNLLAGNRIDAYALQNQEQSYAKHESRNNLWGITTGKTDIEDRQLKQTAVVTSLQSSDTLTSQSGGDSRYQATRLSGQNVNLQAGLGDPTGQVLLEGVKEMTQTSHTEKGKSILTQGTKGEGDTTETLKLAEIHGKLNINAPGGIVAQLPEGDFKSQISQLSQQPGREWLGDLLQNPNVNWQQVALLHDHWQYDHQGLTPAASVIIAIIVAIATQGMGAGMLTTAGTAVDATVSTTVVTAGTTITTEVGIGTVTTTTLAAGATTAVSTVAVTIPGVMANAAFTTLASQAAVGLANNRGDVGKTMSELGRSDTVKGMVASMLTAGVSAGFGGTYDATRLAADTAAGCASGALTGSGCKQGASQAAVMSGLAWGGHLMRKNQIESSGKFKGFTDSKGNHLDNLSGYSVGVDGDLHKIGGGRIKIKDVCIAAPVLCGEDGESIKSNFFNKSTGVINLPDNYFMKDGQVLSIKNLEKALPKSPLGGLQGSAGQLNVFGITINYSRGDFIDKVVESFAGPHDQLNSFHYYDVIGNNLSDTSGLWRNEIWNIIDVGFAAPFGISTLCTQTPGLCDSIQNADRIAKRNNGQ